MHIYLRVDSSLSIGTGHIVRCLNLAKYLRKIGAACYFVSKPHTGNVISKIEVEGFTVKKIPVGIESEGYITDEKSWLNGTQIEDANSFIDLVSEVGVIPNIIIVDHYSLDYEWEGIIKARYPFTRLVVIDDLCNRSHFADVIIDQTFKRRPEEYIVLNKINGKICSGTKYALINPDFAALSAKSISRKKTLQAPKSVLITMGGVDPKNVTGTILAFLNELGSGSFDFEKVTVVMGRASPNQLAIQYAANNARYRTEVLVDVDRMPELMLEHDIAIGALGGTTWERCVMGLPAVNIAIADNQMSIAESLRNSGAIVLYSNSLNANNFKAALAELITEFKKHILLTLDICDGYGILRAVQEILPIPAKNGINVTLRPATVNDIDYVYKLQCEPHTRKFARNPQIPDYENHVAWMKRKLNDDRAFFYVIENRTACGVLRLDPIEHSLAKVEISIFIAKSNQGNGIASAAIKRAVMLHKDMIILATVLTENHASHMLFQRLGFIQMSNSEYLSELSNE